MMGQWDGSQFICKKDPSICLLEMAFGEGKKETVLGGLNSEVVWKIPQHHNLEKAA